MCSGERSRNGRKYKNKVLWLDTGEAFARDDVPELTKKLLRCALSGSAGLVPLPYEGNLKHGKGYLYGVD